MWEPHHPAHYWPKHIVRITKDIQATHSLWPSPPLFLFELSQESANKNYCVLKQFNMNIETALRAQADSPLGYGSEFRKTATLRPLLYLNPNWPRFERLLNEGSDWPLNNIDDSDRARDVEEALSFGNHKGASNYPDLLTSLIKNDVEYSFAAPFPLTKMIKIPGIWKKILQGNWPWGRPLLRASPEASARTHPQRLCRGPARRTIFKKN